MPYRDLREYLARLDETGNLWRIKTEVDKDWEIAAVARRAFQKVPEERRKAFLFEKVKGFPTAVCGGTLGASRAVYALSLETAVDKIQEKWDEARKKPLPPVQAKEASCKENVLKGDRIDLLKFPVPVWTVGQDPGPYLTAPLVCSYDSESRIRNIGTYRVQIKSSRRIGLFVNEYQDLRRTVTKNERRGIPTPVAVVVGTEPTTALVSVSKAAYDVDEFALAGGLRGAPLEIVRCETNDVEVPATAELVIEGKIMPGEREHEGPFGEYTGYMGPAGDAYVIDVECVTHRHNPIHHTFISQMPPSESSLIRGYGREAGIMRHLKQLGIPVVDVHLPHEGGAAAILAISLKKDHPAQPMHAMWAAWCVYPSLGKTTVVVDDDIDIRDMFELQWAMSFRVQPAKDVQIVPVSPVLALDPSIAPEEVPQHVKGKMTASKIAIDATKKHDYPALALPPKEHLLRVDEKWEAYGLE